MRVLLQRVSEANVVVAGEQIACIGRGLLAFVGVFPGDGEAQALWLARKTLDLRIFPGKGKAMNASVKEIGGAVLAVSQFTLAADTTRGNRPGFSGAADPAHAKTVYERYVAALSEDTVAVQTGRFGADMQVALLNDGPVTILLERF